MRKAGRPPDNEKAMEYSLRVRIDGDIYGELQDYCVLHGISVSAAVREAVKLLLQK